jgi:hypothetical protein
MNCDVGVTLITGVGLTVIVNVWTGPVHPLADGVTANTAYTGVVPVFTPAKAGMVFVVPLAVAKPIAVLLFVQLYVVPASGLVNVIAVVFVVLQTA